jgi:uncharacterized protein (DUF2147 family)
MGNSFVNAASITAKRNEDNYKKVVEEMKEKIKKLEEENAILKKDKEEKEKSGKDDVRTPGGSVSDKSGGGEE